MSLTWSARAIAPNEDFDGAPLPRAEFGLDEGHGPITRATLHATAHGVLEAYLSGKPVSDDVLSPGWSLRVAAARPGKAVPQIYLTYPFSAGEPPAQLKAFQVVRLNPAEAREVMIDIPAMILRFLTRNLNCAWFRLEHMRSVSACRPWTFD
jgi:Fibronectin type III-like domain/Alpha-L-rhamnosidase N-terminal domain